MEIWKAQFKTLAVVPFLALNSCSSPQTGQPTAPTPTNNPASAVTKFALSSSKELEAAIDQKALRDRLTETVLFFENNFWSVNHAIPVEIGGEKCRTGGYDFSTKTVRFCPAKNLVKAGTESLDVIHHEMFHAMLCDFALDLCDEEAIAKPENKMVHEALANHFAFMMSPDEKFGEKYFVGRESVRSYKSSYCYSLASTPEEKTAALTFALTSGPTPFTTIRSFVLGNIFRVEDLAAQAKFGDSCLRPGDEAPRITVKNSDGRAIKSNSITVPPQGTTLSFVLNAIGDAIYPKLQLQWTRSGQPENRPLLKIESSPGSGASAAVLTLVPVMDDTIDPKRKTEREHLEISLLARGRDLGSMVFTFSAKRIDPPPPPPPPPTPTPFPLPGILPF